MVTKMAAVLQTKESLLACVDSYSQVRVLPKALAMHGTHMWQLILGTSPMAKQCDLQCGHRSASSCCRHRISPYMCALASQWCDTLQGGLATTGHMKCIYRCLIRVGLFHSRYYIHCTGTCLMHVATGSWSRQGIGHLSLQSSLLQMCVP